METINTRNTLIEMWLKGLAETPHDAIYHRGESGYEHSLHVAILCHRNKLDPLFGLLHDIGKVPTCSVRTDNQGRERISFFDHGEVGALWLSSKKIKKLLDIDDDFIERIRWHLTPYLKHNEKKYADKRTWIQDQYYKCDKLGGKEPGDEKHDLKEMLTWPYQTVIEWAYDNRSSYLIGKDQWFFNDLANQQ